jgi:hypothetical protein
MVNETSNCCGASSSGRRSRPALGNEGRQGSAQGAGRQPQLRPARDINALARDYLAEHRAFFVVEAKQAIATWPEFARWRCAEIASDAQSQEQPKSITSAVQMLGAK